MVPLLAAFGELVGAALEAMLWQLFPSQQRRLPPGPVQRAELPPKVPTAIASALRADLFAFCRFTQRVVAHRPFS